MGNGRVRGEGREDKGMEGDIGDRKRERTLNDWFTPAGSKS